MRIILCLMIGGLSFLGCSSDSDESSNKKQVFWPTKDSSTDGDGHVTSYSGDSSMTGSGSWRNRFYLQFGGGTVTSQDSFIVEDSGKSSVVIPPFAASDLGAFYANADLKTVKKEIMAQVKTIYADLNIEFVDSEPEKPYSTVYIGGSDFTGGNGTLGVAPLDISNFSGEDILYIFTKEFSSFTDEGALDIAVNVTAHEIAHSLGAKHVVSAQAIMNPSVGPDHSQLDVEAPLASEDGKENTKTLVLQTVGSKDEVCDDAATLPEIANITMSSQEDNAQLSVFHPENAEKNPNLDISCYNYEWEYAGATAPGHSVRILFPGDSGTTYDVFVTVSNNSGQSARYAFEVVKKSVINLH